MRTDRIFRFQSLTTDLGLILSSVNKFNPRYFLAGGICASFSHGIAVPFDVVKTRLQTSTTAEFADTGVISGECVVSSLFDTSFLDLYLISYYDKTDDAYSDFLFVNLFLRNLEICLFSAWFIRMVLKKLSFPREI